MGAAAQFGEILERKLADTGAAEPWSALRDRQAFQRRPPAAPLFFAGTLSVEPGPAWRAARSAYGPGAPARPDRRPGGRRLTRTEQHAAEDLRRLGATGLGDDFSPADVKRAYRALARRFHPDAHPGATDSERLYLAEAFNRINAAYQQLMTTPVLRAESEPLD